MSRVTFLSQVDNLVEIETDVKDKNVAIFNVDYFWYLDKQINKNCNQTFYHSVYL